MTPTQYLVLTGVIWIAPHTNKWYALTIGFIFTLMGLATGLGLI